MSGKGFIEFTKAEASGNDFLIVSAGDLARERWPEFTRYACDRHRGLGADGVEFVAALPSTPEGVTQLELTLLNADGSEAEISGNGSRCVAAFWAEGAGVSEVMLHTAAGPRYARLTERDGGGNWEAEIEMGVPTFPAGIPTEIEGWQITPVSMGNPHCCLFVDHFPANWEQLGARLEGHPAFPHRTNVEFVRILGPNQIELRIFERGVGPTNSSGTGSCAAAAASIAAGYTASPTDVFCLGGPQTVTWAGGAAVLMLAGSARIVAAGQIAYVPS